MRLRHAGTIQKCRICLRSFICTVHSVLEVFILPVQFFTMQNHIQYAIHVEIFLDAFNIASILYRMRIEIHETSLDCMFPLPGDAQTVRAHSCGWPICAQDLHEPQSNRHCNWQFAFGSHHLLLEGRTRGFRGNSSKTSNRNAHSSSMCYICFRFESRSVPRPPTMRRCGIWTMISRRPRVSPQAWGNCMKKWFTRATLLLALASPRALETLNVAVMDK